MRDQGLLALAKEKVLTIIVIILSGSSVSFLILGSLSIVPYVPFRNFVLIPSVIAIFAIGIYAHSKFQRFSNRLFTGMWVGAVATFALEVFRIPGYLFARWIPMDTMITVPGMFLTDQASSFMAAKEIMMSSGVPAHLYVASPDVLLAGALWHFWNGATFGLTYALLVGRGKWWYGVTWGFIVEIVMMLAPWVIMMMGPFGVRYLDGYNLFTLTLIAHLAFGAVVGLLVSRFVKDRESFIKILRAHPKINNST